MEPLIMAAKSPSIEVQREAAAALCNLALAEENKVIKAMITHFIFTSQFLNVYQVIMARGGALPALIALAMSGDKEREVY